MTATLAPPQRQSSASRTLPRVRIMGVDFAAITAQDAVELLVDRALDEATTGCWVVTANLDHLRRYAHDRGVRELIDEAEVVVADGTPIVMASRVAGVPLPERVAGSSMVMDIARRAADRDASIFLLGGAPGVAERAAEVLMEGAPGLRIAGTSCPAPGFEHEPAALRSVEEELLAAGPDIVLLALSFPKTDMLIRRLRGVLPGVSFMGVGIALSFIVGDVHRAPTWVQVAGLEWLHRVVQEPRRLWRRYLLHGMPFAARLVVAAGLARVQRRVGGPWYRHADPDTVPRIGLPSG